MSHLKSTSFTLLECLRGPAVRFFYLHILWKWFSFLQNLHCCPFAGQTVVRACVMPHLPHGWSQVLSVLNACSLFRCPTSLFVRWFSYGIYIVTFVLGLTSFCLSISNLENATQIYECFQIHFRFP